MYFQNKKQIILHPIKKSILTLLSFLIFGQLFYLTGFSQDLKLPAIISDHALFSQNQDLNIWGWAKPHTEVFVKIECNANGKKYELKSKSDHKGQWLVQFPPLKGGEIYHLNVRSAGESLVVHDIAIGELWIGAGQSNMQFSLIEALDRDTLISRADHLKMRFFKVHFSEHEKEQDDLKGEWQIVDSKNIGALSAVLAFAGDTLYQNLKVPIGFVQVAIGSTAAHLYTPVDVLNNHTQLKHYIENYYRIPKQYRHVIFPEQANFEIRNIQLIGKEVEDQIVSTSSLITHPKSNLIVSKEKVSYHGEVSFQSREGIEMAVDGKTALKYEGLRFDYKSSHPLALRVKSTHLPDWLAHDSRRAMPSEEWKTEEIRFMECGLPDWFHPKSPVVKSNIKSLGLVAHPHGHFFGVPGGLYNAMLHPLKNMTFSGLIWYQGESNDPRPKEYGTLLASMIKGWRSNFKREFPVVVVQLPLFKKRVDDPVQLNSSWAIIREAQKNILKLLNTGLAVTIDTGHPKNIHPPYKGLVGQRAGAVALNLVYGKELLGTGPIINASTFQDRECLISFDFCGDGLKTKDNEAIKGFALAGEDQQFHFAKAEIISKNQIKVSCKAVAKPVALRYAWADNPDVNLINSKDLPASPFRTDNW